MYTPRPFAETDLAALDGLFARAAYALAHRHGKAEILDDAASLQRIVATLAERYERALGNRWRFPDSAPSQLPALAGIVGFRFAGQRTELKFKLNQNHPEQNVRGAINGLLAVADDNAVATAALMQQPLDYPHPASETTHVR